jgi:hypothetical protein
MNRKHGIFYNPSLRSFYHFSSSSSSNNNNKIKTTTMTTTTTTSNHTGSAASSTPRYTSILVARRNHQRPCDLEVQLRNHCQKMRVYEKPLSGAQFVFPDIPGLAIRIHYDDWQHQHVANNNNNHHNTAMDKQQSEDVLSFSKTFRHAILFLVIPNITDLDRGDDDNDNATEDKKKKNQMLQQILLNYNDYDNDDSSLRIMVVPDTQHVLTALEHMGDALLPARRKLRQEFSKRCQIYNFCLPPSDHKANTILTDSNHNNQNSSSSINHPDTMTIATMNSAAAATILHAIVQWGQRFRLEPWEAEILWKCSGSNLKQFVTMAATSSSASSSKLQQHVPVSSRAKHILEQFFSENGPMNDEVELEGNEDLAGGNALYLSTRNSINTLHPPMIDKHLSMEPDYSQYHQPCMNETVPRVSPHFSLEWNDAAAMNHLPSESNFIPRNREYNNVQQQQQQQQQQYLPPPATYWENHHNHRTDPVLPVYNKYLHPEFSVQPQRQQENEDAMLRSRLHHIHPTMTMHGARHPQDEAPQLPHPLSYDKYAHNNTPWIQTQQSVPTTYDNMYPPPPPPHHHHSVSEPDPRMIPRSALPAARSTPWGHPPPHRVSYNAIDQSSYHGHTTHIDSSTSAVYNNHYTHVPSSAMTHAQTTQQYRMMM